MIKDFIKNKSGEYSGATYIFAIFIIITTIILSIVFGKVYVIFTMANKVKETMKEATLYVMTSNWDELYSSEREGYAGAYTYDGKELLDSERVYDIMQYELETKKVGNEYIKYADNNQNEVIYKYYNISMNINNTGYKNVNDSFRIDLSLTFEAPFNLLFISFPMKVELKSRASWTAKY